MPLSNDPHAHVPESFDPSGDGRAQGFHELFMAWLKAASQFMNELNRRREYERILALPGFVWVAGRWEGHPRRLEGADSAVILGVMRDKELYATILGLQAPWIVEDVELSPETEEVSVRIGWQRGATLRCPECGAACPGYDTRRRSWRHLDTCQYRTVLVAEVPRVKCSEHGVRQIEVPWAEPGSRFTALFEALAIDWLHAASIAAVARCLRVTWDELDGIQARAVRRGLARREREVVRRIGVDETSFQKRHEYVTVVCDLEGSRVLHVGDGRSQEVLARFYEGLDEEQLAGIEVVAMDMWWPYIKATLEHVPEAERKVAFDKFHVVKHLNEAVNEVRKREHRQLRSMGDERLTGTRYLWLQSPEKMTKGRRKRFEELRDSNLKVARAWAIKETARDLWSYVRRGWAEKAWGKWLGWVARCRLEPIRKVGRTLKDHLWGILNAIVLRATNAASESLNARIQWLKKTACGFRNRERFRNAIYFHCGGLDLYPRLPTHTVS